VRNIIKEIVTEGRKRVIYFEEIKEEAFLFFKGLLSEDQISLDRASDFLHSMTQVISPTLNQNLLDEISEAEVKDVIWSLDLEKAPSPYGFSIRFY